MTQAPAETGEVFAHEKEFHFTREMMRGPVYRKYEKALVNGLEPS